MTCIPGSQFNYSDGTTHLVSVVLTEATGMTALEFAAVNLFEPLGIEAYSWTADNRGYNFGGVRLKITPLTMLKFGQLSSFFLAWKWWLWHQIPSPAFPM